ncbi:hypothetical protein SKAU_G00213190 [Synaphobranchus kaupii]|uniref:Uncharacterized protein n=1 Tax=Synaphobranchus kaupii TaxID=118154 RepID=A0A9Q1F9J4_SYNKA|nr:hypothetical protein SKAU_G00213190 [Synaphobranchus kaupii]
MAQLEPLMLSPPPPHRPLLCSTLTVIIVPLARLFMAGFGRGRGAAHLKPGCIILLIKPKECAHKGKAFSAAAFRPH